MSTGGKEVRVTLVQTDIRWCDAAANRAHIEGLLRQAPPTDLVVLPEMFTTGFCLEPGQAAEPALGDTVQWMLRLCRERDCALAGSISVCEAGRHYNRLYFVQPGGQVTAYDKRHLFAYGGEQRCYVAGQERVVVSWRGVRFLLQVCYDLRFPVFARNRGDYDAILYVANWPEARIAAWDALLTARALENQCYVLAVNRVGNDPLLHYPGHSRAIDAYGRMLAADTSGLETLLTVGLDMERLVAFRRKFPVLEDADDFALLG